MSSTLLFSVLISTYHKDNPLFLKSALNSIFDQSLLPEQVALIIDGPIPYALESVINEFRDSHPAILNIYKLDKNVGLGPALNYGLLKCRNELVARMDSDDICLKERFQKQIEHFMMHPSVDVLGADVEEFSKFPGDLKRVNKTPEATKLYQYSRWRNPINHPTVMFKKSAVLAANSYENVPYFEDYYLWINLLKKGYQIDNLQEVLVNFRNDIDTIGRRHGFAYIKHELYFFYLAFKNSYLELPYIIAGILIRIPIRFLPKKILSKFYNTFLRK